MTLISNFPAFPVEIGGVDIVVENVIVERFAHRGGKLSLPTPMALLKFPKNAQEPNKNEPMTERTVDGHLFSSRALPPPRRGRPGAQVMTKRTKEGFSFARQK